MRAGGGIAVGALAAALVAACSSSGGGGNASTASGFAQQFCALLAPCCADAGLSTSGQSCQALLGSGLGGTYDAAKGQACLDALKQDSSKPGFCSGGLSDPACNGVYSSSSGGGSGSTPPGQPCKFDTDCAAGSGGGAACVFGGFADGGSASVCVQTQTGKAGDGPCVGTANGSVTSYSWGGSGTAPAMGYICNIADGVTCSSTTQKCTTLAPTGQPCSSDGDCVTADYCDFSAMSGSACAPRLADGASCANGLFDACKTTSNCDQTSMTCVAGLSNGSACTSGEPCASHACVNGKCASSSNFGLDLFCQ